MWNVGLSRGRAEQGCRCTIHVGWNVLFNMFYVHNADFSCWKQVTWHFPLAVFHFISLQASPPFAFYLEGKMVGKEQLTTSLSYFVRKGPTSHVYVSGRWFVILENLSYFDPLFVPGPSSGWPRLASLLSEDALAKPWWTQLCAAAWGLRSGADKPMVPAAPPASWLLSCAIRCWSPVCLVEYFLDKT